MKKQIAILSLAILAATGTAYSQFTPTAPKFGGPMGKLFGDTLAFSSTLHMQSTGNDGKTITMPGKVSVDHGNSRFEMNMADVQGVDMSPDAAEQMKSMGMDKIAMVTRLDKKASYLIYPGMQSYVETKLSKAESATNNADMKVEVTQVGKETVDGHPCVQNKVIVTDADGKKHESTVWNASDLGNFPVKIESTENSHKTVMSFTDIKRTAPDASNFELPADYKKYDSASSMMRAQMMKKMGGGIMGGFSPFGH